MKRFILSMSMVLAVAMSMQAEQKAFYLPDFTIDGLDYEIQQVVGNIGFVRVNDINEPYVTGTVTIPRTVTYDGTTYYVQAVDGFWPEEGGLTKLVIPSGVDSVLATAFTSVSTLQTVDLTNVAYIGASAFSDCAIKELTLNGVKLKKMENTAFGRNKSMTKLTIASIQLTELPDFAFAGCEKLADISLGIYLTKIGKQAFSLNPSLTTITLPASLQSLGDEVFYNDENLKEIKVLAMIPPTCTTKTFDGLDKTKVKVIVPAGTATAYKNATGWKNFNISDGTQAVSNVYAEEGQSAKIIENGQILILRGDKMYTLTGQEVR